MNASAIILFLVAALLAVVSCLPPVNEPQLLSQEEKPEPEEETSLPEEADEGVGLRFPRATCDLLSISTPIGSLNHAACAAHCLTLQKGFKGGRCQDGVCHCRK